MCVLFTCWLGFSPMIKVKLRSSLSSPVINTNAFFRKKQICLFPGVLRKYFVVNGNTEVILVLEMKENCLAKYRNLIVKNL